MEQKTLKQVDEVELNVKNIYQYFTFDLFLL
jgi:hypothetical protein